MHQIFNASNPQLFSLSFCFFWGLLKHFAISQQADIKHDHNHNLISISALECLIRMCINAPSLLVCFMPHHTISTLTKQGSFLLNEILVHENPSQFQLDKEEFFSSFSFPTILLPSLIWSLRCTFVSGSHCTHLSLHVGSIAILHGSLILL